VSREVFPLLLLFLAEFSSSKDFADGGAVLTLADAARGVLIRRFLADFGSTGVVVVEFGVALPLDLSLGVPRETVPAAFPFGVFGDFSEGLFPSPVDGRLFEPVGGRTVTRVPVSRFG